MVDLSNLADRAHRKLLASEAEIVRSEEGIEDASSHLRHLSAAVALANPELFEDYVAWTRDLVARPQSSEELRRSLEKLRKSLLERIDGDEGQLLDSVIERALRRLVDAPEPESAGQDRGDGPDVSRGRQAFDAASWDGAAAMQRYLDLLLDGRHREASRLIIEAARSGVSIPTLYLEVIQPAMWKVGDLWQDNRITIADEHFVTAATHRIMSQLAEWVYGQGERTHRAIIATPIGETHELGARMIADLLEIDGWDTRYLGTDVPGDALVAELADYQPHLLALSVTLTAHLPMLKSTISTVRRADSESALRILVGGNPFNQFPELWRSVGADGTATDALEAARLAGALVSEKSG